MIPDQTDVHGRLRSRAAGWPMLMLAALLSSAASAGGGDDHSLDPPPAAASAQGIPRVAMQSDLYQVVGILKGDRLTVYVDRAEDNTPVIGARVSVTVASEDLPVTANADGTYAVSSPHLAETGSNDLVVTVAGPDGKDLLIGSLVVTEPAAREGPHATASILARVKKWFGRPDPVRGWALAAFAVGLTLGLGLRNRRLRPPAFLTGAVLVVVLTAAALAHGDEVHDHDATTVTPGSSTPRRLPDGSVYVPKPSQRILEVRTTPAKPTEVEGATRLISKVIVDPDKGGLVQSIGGGRVIAPDAGMPRLGQPARVPRSSPTTRTDAVLRSKIPQSHSTSTTDAPRRPCRSRDDPEVGAHRTPNR